MYPLVPVTIVFFLWANAAANGGGGSGSSCAADQHSSTAATAPSMLAEAETAAATGLVATIERLEKEVAELKQKVKEIIKGQLQLQLQLKYQLYQLNSVFH